MESKKDIGKFFKENLDQLDVAPSVMVWDGIEKELTEKKKKIRFLFWFFIAAFLGGSIFTYTALHFGLVSDFNTKDEKNTQPSGINVNSVNNKNTTQYNNNNQENLKYNNGWPINSKSNEIESLTNTTSKNTKSSSNSETTLNSGKHPSEIDKKSSLRNNLNRKQSISFTSKKTKQKKNSNGLSNDEINRSILAEKSSETKNENNATQDAKNSLLTVQKESNPTSIDSLQKKNVTNTEKEKSLKETKKDSATELPKEKSFDFIIAPYYGYTYPGKLGGGNSLSTQYNVLDEGGKPSQNFGVLVRWMGTEKIGIQTGIGIVQSHRFTEVEKNGTFFSNNINLELDNPLETYSLALQNDDRVTIHEENSYVEVPLELYYIVSNNKLGMATSLGFSLFFLNKNDVYLESDSVNKFRIGSLNTTLQQSISTNFKLNLFYKLSKRIQLDVYPEFQFQIMSHKDVSGFYPYYVSLKAGVSYKL